MLDTRVPLAVGASLLLHGAALTLADRLPLGWPQAGHGWSDTGVAMLHARLDLRLEHGRPADAPSPAPRGIAVRAGAVGGDSAVAPGVIAVPSYIPADQLDERPQISSHVEPAFPLDANAPSGRVVLRLLIAETGAVDKVLVVEAEPPGPFGAAAVEAFQPARFSPGRKRGVPVKSAVTLELRFGAAPDAGSSPHRQDVPLFQPPRRAPVRRIASAQEKP